MKLSEWRWLQLTPAVLCGAALIIAGCGTTDTNVSASEEAAGARPATNKWKMCDNERNRFRVGQALVYVPELRQLVFLGGAEVEGAYVRAFDPQSRTWSDLSEAKPEFDKSDRMAYGHAVVYDADTRGIFLLHGNSLYSFDLASKSWTARGSNPLLASLTAKTMAYDPVNKQLVVVGAGKTSDELGWTVTLTYDVSSKKWQKLTFGNAEARAKQTALLAGIDALAELVGRTRLAWYRDPKQIGTEEELAELKRRCEGLKKMPALGPVRKHIEKIAKLIDKKKTLDALKAQRALQRKLEEMLEAQAPTPPARRRSPLVSDPVNQVMVLFGGDHEDYLMNDTWVLDLTTLSWRRANPKLAPSPRAGHALVYLPGSGKIALWDGYRQRSKSKYRAFQAGMLPNRELWVYDVKNERWALLASWPTETSHEMLPTYVGFINDHSGFAPSALIADSADNLILCTVGPKLHSKPGRTAHWLMPDDGREFQRVKDFYNATWIMPIDVTKVDKGGTRKLGHRANQRGERTGLFVASFCEVEDKAEVLSPDQLEPNTWTLLPEVPRNCCFGQRQRDWGTATWDPDQQQVLYWGGGHCVTGSSTVVHYSPASNRMVEGYDSDEDYSHWGSRNGTLLGRAWVPTHSYNIYAYDTRSELMVVAKQDGTYLYDPLRMDWLKEKIAQPFYGHCYETNLVATPHGMVAWAPTKDRNSPRGLWLFDRETGWQDLKPVGNVPATVVDGSGICYDSKRDRLLLAAPRAYNIDSDGTLYSFDFTSRKVEKIVPANLDYGKARNCREMIYVVHADYLLLVEGTTKEGKYYNRVYDCARNRWLLIETGAEDQVQMSRHSTGLAYDGRRKVVFAITAKGKVWALKLKLGRAKVLSVE